MAIWLFQETRVFNCLKVCDPHPDPTADLRYQADTRTRTSTLCSQLCLRGPYLPSILHVARSRRGCGQSSLSLAYLHRSLGCDSGLPSGWSQTGHGVHVLPPLMVQSKHSLHTSPSVSSCGNLWTCMSESGRDTWQNKTRGYGARG